MDWAGSLEPPKALLGLSVFALVVVTVTFVCAITFCAALRIMEHEGEKGLLRDLWEETSRAVQVYVTTVAAAALVTLIGAALAVRVEEPDEWIASGEALLSAVNLQLVVSVAALTLVFPFVTATSVANLLERHPYMAGPWRRVLVPPFVMAVPVGLTTIVGTSALWEVIAVVALALVGTVSTRVWQEHRP